MVVRPKGCQIRETGGLNRGQPETRMAYCPLQVFVVPPSVSEEQVNCLAQIYTGQLGGLPWSILGTTYEVAGLVRADVNINAAGRESSFSVPGVGEAKGDYLKNAVTGKRHEADINLAEGFIWKKGECGVGSFKISAEGINLDYKDTNWILYDFDWNSDV